MQTKNEEDTGRDSDAGMEREGWRERWWSSVSKFKRVRGRERYRGI